MNAQRMAVGILLGVLTSISITRGFAQQGECLAVTEFPSVEAGADAASQLPPADGAACTPACDELAVPTCTLCPSFYGSVESLFLERNNASALQPVVITAPSPTQFTTVLTTQDLQFGFAPGLRALVGARLHDGWAIESSYLGLYNASSTASAFQPNPPPLRFPDGLGAALNVFSNAYWMGIDYGSQLHSVDLSLVCCQCCCPAADDCRRTCRSCEWLIGFRYLNLTETLQIRGLEQVRADTFDGLYAVHTRNDLYGTQVGGRIRRCLDRWSLEATAKAGIYVNDAEQQQQIVDALPLPLWRDEVASGCRVAFVGEVSLSGIYQLTDVWGLRAGYNLIGIEGVALAPDQLDFSGRVPAGNWLDSNGGVLLHGVSFGLEARW